jgi:hypothetical protein
MEEKKKEKKHASCNLCDERRAEEHLDDARAFVRVRVCAAELLAAAREDGVAPC